MTINATLLRLPDAVRDPCLARRHAGRTPLAMVAFARHESPPAAMWATPPVAVTVLATNDLDDPERNHP